MNIRPLVKIHGGKYYQHHHLIILFPFTYHSYIEPFIGGGSILLNKEPNDIEIINDIDNNLFRLYLIVRDSSDEFIERLNSLEYSLETFTYYLNLKVVNPIDVAIREYVVRRMSRGGLMKSFCWANRLRGGKPSEINSWQSAINQLPIISKRLKKVQIRNTNALRVIQEYDNKDTFFYCDPPYLPATRVSRKAYSHEMTQQDHIDLAGVLNSCKGKVLLSGYNSDLYQELYSSWYKSEYTIVNHSSQKKTKEKKIEVCWSNYDPSLHDIAVGK